MSQGDEWCTPPWLFDLADGLWGPFTLDAAASHDNALCAAYLTRADDGLTADWGLHTRVWINPPYSNPFPWLERAAIEGEKGRIVCVLMPADTSTAYFHEIVMRRAAVVRFLRPRIRFVGANGSPKFGSVFAVFGPHDSVVSRAHDGLHIACMDVRGRQ